MSDRPILFSGLMIRALLDGRKTQTRRDLTKTFLRYPQLAGYETKGFLKNIEGKEVPCVEFTHSERGLWHPDINPDGRSGWYVPLKAAVGDRLWVRETWQGLSFGDCLPTKSHPCEIRYAATDPCADLDTSARGYPWRPSIFMPRWASRITLTVTDILVERLQNMSEQDAIAEGCFKGKASGRVFTNEASMHLGGDEWGNARDWYADLWDSINPKSPWEKNPWVAAYTFEVELRNIDEVAR